MGYLLHQSPKFYNNVFLFVDPTTYGTYYDWLVHQVECSNVSTTKGLILCIIIWNVHQFIGHCVIPLDPWF